MAVRVMSSAIVQLDLLRVLAELAPNSLKFDEKHMDVVKELCMVRMPDSLDANMDANEETLGTKAPYRRGNAFCALYNFVSSSVSWRRCCIRCMRW